MTHELKCFPEFFRAIVSGEKTFEVRRTRDRKFSVGDKLVLKEWDAIRLYSGASVDVRVTFILEGSLWGLEPDVVVMSFRPWSVVTSTPLMTTVMQ